MARIQQDQFIDEDEEDGTDDDDNNEGAALVMNSVSSGNCTHFLELLLCSLTCLTGTASLDDLVSLNF